MKDVMGKAIWDYQNQNQPEDVWTETNISEADAMSVAYLFRGYQQMPPIEQKAMQLAHGRVLDVGCGAGSHSLYLQNNQKLEVTAIDVSPRAIEVCRARGIEKAYVQDVMTMELQSNAPLFDTLLLLMNGTGICGKLVNIFTFFQKLKSLLQPKGQILIDSSDLIYMFDKDQDGGVWIPTETDYYGELTFELTYKGEKETPFPWLYLDYHTLENAALSNGLSCERVMEGSHYDYLARLQIL